MALVQCVATVLVFFALVLLVTLPRLIADGGIGGIGFARRALVRALIRRASRNPAEHRRGVADELLLGHPLGRTGPEVLADAKEVLEFTPRGPGVWRLANGMINSLITAGFYSEALAVETHWGEDLARSMRDRPGAFMLREFVLVQINLAEALYNTGRWEEAWKKLEGLDEGAHQNRITRAGLQLQRAWIASCRGRPEEGLKTIERVHLRDLPRAYRSEIWFTRAMALAGLARFEEARHAVQEGLRTAVRVPTERNGLFLLGRISALEGRDAEAEELFRRGASHEYLGQGGDGLLGWGDCLQRLGRPDEARSAWQLAIDRDPQSEGADTARQRLGSERSGALTRAE